MKPNSIKFEISILYTVILGLILIVFSCVLFIISNTFLHQIDTQLKFKAQAVDMNIRSYLSALGTDHNAFIDAVGKTIAMKNENIFQYKTWKVSQKWVRQAQSLNLNRDYINVISDDGKEVLSSSNLNSRLRGYFLEDMQFPFGDQVDYKTLNVRHKNIRVINYPFNDKLFGSYLIQVGEAQEPIVQQLHKWLFSIAISVPIVLVLTSFVGRILTNRILQPVYEITTIANRITQHDLSSRIKNKHFGMEMEALVSSFNEMIARLERSFKHIEQFSYHVAHELKTPMTVIQGESELLLRKERTVQEYQLAFKIVIEESKRVRQTIDDLLLLTKLDYQSEALNFENFDFIEFLNEIAQQNTLLLAHTGGRINIDLQVPKLPLMIKGDKLHLRRLFFNIIDNAVKFTPLGENIDIRVTCHHDKIITAISDKGPGIAEENFEKIFDEFFRVDNNVSGSGLGLNIANTIAKLHQGQIQVESKLGFGATFRVILPI